MNPDNVLNVNVLEVVKPDEVDKSVTTATTSGFLLF